MRPLAPPRTQALRAVALILAMLGSAGAAGAQDPEDAVEARPSAKTILAAAFSNRYEVDLTANIELVMRNASGDEHRRRFEAVSKLIDDRLHSIGRVVWPPYLRGMTILSIEAQNRSHDAFVYLPSQQKVRRVSLAQRGDSFFGTDVTYEDLERGRVEDYELDGLGSEELAGETVFVIRARPLRKLHYAHVHFVVAQSDASILETRYFKRGEERPFRLISAPREAMVEADGHVFPTRLTIRNLMRETTTEIRMRDLEINPAIDDRVFSIGTLEQERALPKSEAQDPR